MTLKNPGNMIFQQQYTWNLTKYDFENIFSDDSLFAILFDNQLTDLEDYVTDNPHKEKVGVEGVRILRWE